MTGTVPEHLDEFIEQFFAAATEGVAHLWEAADKRSRWINLRDPAAATKTITTIRGRVDRSDLYYGVSSRRQDLGPDLRGGDDDCHQRFALVGDLDISGPGHHKTAGLFPDIDTTWRTLGKMLLPPTFVIYSGGGLQPGWCLAEPEDANDPAVARLQRRLIATLRRHAGPYAGGVDNVSAPAQLMRLPGTYNLKTGEPRPVLLVERSWATRYNLSDFDDALDEIDDHDEPTFTPRDEIDFDLTDGPICPTVQAVLDRAIEICQEPPGTSEDTSRHRQTLQQLCTLARLAERGWPGARPAVEQLRPIFIDAVKHDRTGGEREASYEFKSMLKAARHKVAVTEPTTPTKDEIDAEAAARQATEDELAAACRPAAEQSVGPAISCHLPETFWAERPAFQHIRQAARARMVGPDALLGACLARTSTLTDWRIALPPVIGRAASLNVNIALVGAPGLGKGASADTAHDLLPADNSPAGHRVKEAPAGSGEGMVAAYFERVVETDGKRRVAVLRRAYDAIHFRIDEVGFLTALAQRSGQTTLEVIRQAWSAEQLGGSYASADKQARMDRHSYRFALLLAVQPEHGRDLLADDAAGTPQRFTWHAMTDPDAPPPGEEPEWPGPLDWKPPRWDDDPFAIDEIDNHRRRFMRIDPTIAHQIRTDRHDVLTGKSVNAADGHRNLLQLKIAALLAVLDNRLDVNPEDWRLAELILTTSTNVREQMRAVIRQSDEARERSALEKDARRIRDRAAAETGVHADIERVARVIARHVEKHGAVCTIRCIRHALNSPDRHLLRQALGRAVDHQWITGDEEEGFKCGASRPA